MKIKLPLLIGMCLCNMLAFSAYAETIIPLTKYSVLRLSTCRSCKDSDRGQRCANVASQRAPEICVTNTYDDSRSGTGWRAAPGSSCNILGVYGSGGQLMHDRCVTGRVIYPQPVPVQPPWNQSQSGRLNFMVTPPAPSPSQSSSAAGAGRMVCIMRAGGELQCCQMTSAGLRC